MKKHIIAVLAILFSVLPLFSETTNWSFDKPHTHLLFHVKHMLITDVTGYFRIFDGKVVTNGNDFSNAYVELSIDIPSINTDNETRDNHLKSPDFFDAKDYPKMNFKSKSLKKIDESNYEMTGNLTIKNVTKEVKLNLEYNGQINGPGGKTRAGFKLSGKINRFDYGLSWDKTIETGGLIVGKEVKIDCDIELIKQ